MRRYSTHLFAQYLAHAVRATSLFAQAIEAKGEERAALRAQLEISEKRVNRLLLRRERYLKHLVDSGLQNEY